MTSFNSTHLLTAFCLFLFSFQLSCRRSSAFGKAETSSFVPKLCSQSLEPDACQNCVPSGKPIENIPELIYSVLFCMYSQAVYGHDHADELLQNATTSADVKHALRVCSVTLFMASNNLSDALPMMEASKYKDAFANMKNSRRSLIACVYGFRRFATGNREAIPTLLLGDMVLLNRLFEVGHYFFRLIIKINNR